MGRVIAGMAAAYVAVGLVAWGFACGGMLSEPRDAGASMPMLVLALPWTIVVPEAVEPDDDAINLAIAGGGIVINAVIMLALSRRTSRRRSRYEFEV